MRMVRITGPLSFPARELTKFREEHIGYNFTCTPECVGISRDNRPLRRMLELGGSSSKNLLDCYPTSGLQKKFFTNTLQKP